MREASGHSHTDYVFSHHLIQETIYHSLPQAVRNRRHRRIAQVLEEMYPHRLEELAGEIAKHLERAGERGAAAGYYMMAARRALGVYAEIK